MGRGIHTVITDLKMPGLDGMGLLKKLAADHPDVPVIMITAHGSVDNAVEAVKLGAFDYVEKPFDQEQIRRWWRKALKTHAFSRRDPSPERAGGQRPGASGWSATPRRCATSTPSSRRSPTRRRRC